MSTEMRTLRAGNLTLKYDRGFLRYISFGRSEVLRMIYFALRDHNWDTMAGRIEHEVIDIRDASFDISYRWISLEEDFPFQWDVRIGGDSDGKIVFDIHGEALADVRKNRAGFCILHPIEPCAGKPCEILDHSGSWSRQEFPDLISPHQPFFDIKAMRWNVQDLGEALLSFEGDVFETEDQRNWTDDSYKTYCTPLARPFPVTLTKGDVVEQKVSLAFRAHSGTVEETISEVIQLAPKDISMVKPKIGLGVSSSFYHLHPQEVELLHRLHLDHIRAEVKLDEPGWEQKVKHYVSESNQLKLDLMIAVFCGDEVADQVLRLAKVISKLDTEGALHILILQQGHKTTPNPLIDEALEALSRLDRKIYVGAGTNAYFTEFNRDTPQLSGLDFVAYSVNAQVHAFDQASMTETLNGQAHTVRSARALAKDLPVYVSPVTLKPRFNPNATGPEPIPQGKELPDAVDPRQLTAYAACWTLGSIAHLADAGAHAITYFETVGWRGVMQGERQVQMPSLFPAERGMLFPVYHLLREVLTRKDHDWIYLKSSDPLSIKGVFLRAGDQGVILLGNFQNLEKKMEIHLSVSSWSIDFYKGEAVSSDREDPFKRDPDQARGSKGDDRITVTMPPVSLARISIKLI